MLRITNHIYLDNDTNKIIHGDNVYAITEKEKQLFLALWEHASNGKTLSRDQLIPLVWPERKNGITEANLLQLVCKLRRTLRYCDLNEVIHTVYRQGYRFILPFQTEAEAEAEAEAEDVTPEETEAPITPTSLKKTSRIYYPSIIILVLALICVIIAIVSLTPPHMLAETYQYSPEKTRKLSVTETSNGYDLCYRTRENAEAHIALNF